MAAPKEIIRLVENFDRNLTSYRSGAYNEAQVRAEFIDPMFELLGWDVQNKAGNAEAYKDVIHEDAIQIGGTTKAPDYCFRIGGARKFFLEAKKPSVSIKDDPTPAYQLRRYAWSAKLPLSLLTDFEELAIYDCRVKPEKTDKPAIARINHLTFEQYPERWDEIAGVFSKDAVLKGSFDRFAEEKKGKKGTAAVDAEFLKEIERWRELLARNIAIRNPRLSLRELNEAVQRTIDRIVFLRICEDRGIETQYPLQGLQNGTNVYRRLFELFQRADERYNSGLFHFQREEGFVESPDTLTPGLKIDDKPLQDIIANLYYPDSPYEFSVLPADILGQVYEQFLGKVIRLTEGHRAKVEDKPEVKKAGGVYYTPTYIVDYIVEHTVGELLKENTPKQAADLKILDPACGSGSFLLGAYQRLLDWHRDWYLNDGPEKHTKPRKGGQPALFQAAGAVWRLTTAERKRILLNSIFGVDIDPQAVEVTKLSLLLKVLEGESDQTLQTQLKLFQERALPDLASNIKCGNSLIGTDFYQGQQGALFDDEEALRVNAFDWDKGFPAIFTRENPGFDAVIGNPPYGATLAADEVSYIGERFKFQDYQLDSYLLFLERELLLLRFQGFLGLIIPNTWLLNLETVSLRRELFETTQIESIVHYRRPVFPKVTVDTEIVVIRNKPPEEIGEIRLTVVGKDGSRVSYEIPQRRWREANGRPVNVLERPESRDLVDKLGRHNLLDDYYVVTQGTKPFQVGKGKPPQTRRIVDEKPFVSTHKVDKTFRPLLRGSLIQCYQILWDRDQWISFGDWLAEPRYSASHDAPEKIVIRQTGDSLVATLDRKQFVVRDNLYTILPRQAGFDLKYLLGLLNSRLLNWYYQNALNPEKGEALAQVKRGHIAKLPIAGMECQRAETRVQHSRVVGLAQRMLELHNQLAAAGTDHERTVLQRQIDATDREIDQLVYELYGLTEEEISIVEETTT